MTPKDLILNAMSSPTIAMFTGLRKLEPMSVRWFEKGISHGIGEPCANLDMAINLAKTAGCDTVLLHLDPR